MFSHIVIFRTHPDQPGAADELLAGCERYLKPIEGVLHYHAGRMQPSERDVVDRNYEVALNLVFADRAAHDAYQVDPRHIEFVETVFRKTCREVRIYDFA